MEITNLDDEDTELLLNFIHRIYEYPNVKYRHPKCRDNAFYRMKMKMAWWSTINVNVYPDSDGAESEMIAWNKLTADDIRWNGILVALQERKEFEKQALLMREKYKDILKKYNNLKDEIAPA